ncbi:uncharacterized protein E0L32_005808 [Thyridium curvatum]|uniref:Calcineurin-like phosphoesterase domain-containing protein n=1 Tax=Thyridium curvatum TaxID=1093900 RepID=A0A507B588_9PEZI|nr:uncharacterized protein E0L32_005808 [Thyridium curvatum]TPX13864.1 hypothetical protein E0L32_005808 [Thyridium curvatum]
MEQQRHEQKVLTNIKLRGARRRRWAERLLLRYRSNGVSVVTPPENAIRVICISDTHNTQPAVPKGDILIHAGDLTENGSFDEVQQGLNWLSSQPHRYKILVAGNHDVLLDEEFLEKYPERRYGETKGRCDLDWGDIIYLENKQVTLDVPVKLIQHSSRMETSSENEVRRITIFGSPLTPQYGISAFQYRPDSAENTWERILGSTSPKPDIIITHGPPRLHLDARDFHRAGCPHLAEHIARIRPRLHVFGHIHACCGREDIVLDRVQRYYEDVMNQWAGWGAVLSLAWLVAWDLVARVLLRVRRDRGPITAFINASIVGGPQNEIRNRPVEIEI